MSQHDFDIANAVKATVHTDINNALLAIVSNNSGTSAPSPTHSLQWWADTTSGLLKIRNIADTLWITVGSLSLTSLGLLSVNGGTLTGALLAAVGSVGAPGIAFDGDLDSGVYHISGDTWGLVANGVEYCRISTAGITFLGTGSTQLTSGDTSERPGSPVNGMIRYNTELTAIDVYVNGAWKSLVTADNYPFTTDDFEDKVVASGTEIFRSDFGGVSSASEIKQTFDWESPSKLADAASMPSGSSYGASISANDEFFVLRQSSSPYINIYQRCGNELVKLADPASLPLSGGSQYNASFSNTSEYLAAAYITSPHINIYKRAGSVFTKLADPASVPSGAPSTCEFSPNSEFLSIGIVDAFVSTRLNIYQRSGDVFTKLTNPTAPAGDVVASGWSHDSRFLAVVSGTSPYVNIYHRTAGVTFTLLGDPATIPTGAAKDCCFSPDGKYLVVVHASSPYVTIYSRSNITFTKISNPSDLPGSIPNGCAWSADSRYLCLALTSSPYILIYSVESGVFTKLADPSSLPPGKSTSCAWSSDNQFLMLTHEGVTPRFTVYQTGADMGTSSVLTIRKKIRGGK